MMRWLALLALLPAVAVAGERPVLTAAPVWTRDYSFLADPVKRTDRWDALRYIPLGGTSYLSLSGEARLRYEDFTRNPQLGLSGLPKDDYLLERLLLGADLHLGSHFRAFAQLGDHQVDGKMGVISPSDASGVDLQQGFVEALWQGGSVRVGRQEIVLGSQRFFALRDGPNIRQSFDAVRYTGRFGHSDLTVFAAHPVAIGPKDFDDETNRAQGAGAIYLTTPLNRDISADIYLFHFRRTAAKFAQGTASERRESLGVRVFTTRPQPFDFNIEAVWQFGRFGQDDIRAWTFASDFGWTFDTRFRPRLGMKADITSGDHDLHDHALNTFNALFPRGGYFTENGIIGPSNLADLQPSLTLVFSKTVSVNLGAEIDWRQTTADAIYRQPNVPFPNTAGRGGLYTGAQYFVTPTWQATPHVSLSVAAVYFQVSNTVKAAGGGDSVYGAAWASYRF